MSSDVNITELLARVVLLQKESLTALSTPVTSDAVSYFFYTQESFPYWTNRPGAVTFDDNSEEFDADTYTVIMRLVIGHMTSGYRGENEADLYAWIPEIKNYFNSRDSLECATTYTGRMDGLLFAKVTACTGFRAFSQAGFEATQLGTEFTLTCQFTDTIWS